MDYNNINNNISKVTGNLSTTKNQQNNTNKEQTAVINLTVNDEINTMGEKFTPVRKSITILGDSLLKDIKSFKARKSLRKNERLYIKSFSGATTTDMEDYMKPSLKYHPDTILFHIGTNNLRSDDSSTTIAENILNLAKEAKTEDNKVAISGIIVRKDDLNDKGDEVNNIVKHQAGEYGIKFY